jgi:hypothetical protein
MRARRALPVVAGALGLIGLGLVTPPPVAAADPPALVVRGQFQADAGQVGETGTEISAFDPASDRLFSTNGALNRLDVVDLRDVDAPVLLDSVDMAPYGSGLQSVAVHDGLVAVAVQGALKTDAGVVVLLDAASLAVLEVVPVGALPDMVTFTPDGTRILVANEGEPLCTAYDADTDTPTFTDPVGSISVIDVSGGPASASVATAGFGAFDAQKAALAAEGVRFNFFDNSVSQQLEPEYITVSPDGSTAWASLQEANAIAVVDVATATVTDVYPLGLKDHRLPQFAIDASNEDGPGGDQLPGSFRTWPVSGMYMPDAVASFETGGVEYLITANEGDAREWYVGDDEDAELCFVDVERIKDLDLDTTIPELSDPDLQDDDQLGRLNATTTALSTQNGAEEYTSLAVFGGRSATIRNAATGAIVWDSATDPSTDLEDITLAAGTVDDGRSDDKGSEPEAVTVIEAYGTTLALVGLERTSGIVLYDVSDPAAPTFLQYATPPGDESVEGLFTVSAADSPTGTPLVIASHEVSNTVRVLELTGTEPASTPTPVPAVPTVPVVPQAPAAAPVTARPSFVG